MVATSPAIDACHAFDKMCEQSLILKETVNKVDRAMARLHELQSTVRGHKVMLSPGGARGYVRMRMRCKQESLWIQESTKSATVGSNGEEGDWRRWSLPAALVQEAVGEILEASNFAKGIVNIFCDSVSNKLVQDPKTPQSVFHGNGVNLSEERRKKDWKVHRKGCRYNGIRKLNHSHRRITLDNTEHLGNIKAAHSILKTPPGKYQSLITCLQKEGLNGKCFLNGIDRLEVDKKPGYRKVPKLVHKFRMVTPENKVKAASSSLEFGRKAEKQQLRARARAELSEAGRRVKFQMNFPTCNCTANECGRKSNIASTLLSCCTSPAGEQKPLMKVDQITHRRNAWTTHPKLAKTIMFPNPAFVPSSSPSDFRNNSGKLSEKIRCVDSVERKSFTYQKGCDFPKSNQFPLNKENVPLPRKMATRKPSSNLNAAKVKEPIRMIKQVSTASQPATNTSSSFANQKTSPRKFPKFLPPFKKKKSTKHCSSSKKTVWFHRSHNALRSASSPIICNISVLSKQLIHSPVQPLPSLISKLPSRRKRNSSPIPNTHVDLKKKVQPYPVEEGVELETKGSVSGRVLACMKPSNLKYANLSADETQCKSSALDHGRSISCPKQRPLKPIESITNFSGIGNTISNVSEFDMRRRDQQSDNERHDTILKKPNTVLRRSCSLGHDNAVLLRNRKLNSAGIS